MQEHREKIVAVSYLIPVSKMIVKDQLFGAEYWFLKSNSDAEQVNWETHACLLKKAIEMPERKVYFLRYVLLKVYFEFYLK